MGLTSAQLTEFGPDAAARIVNSRGVPGTLGAIARTLHDGRMVLLSTWHVLYGEGARDGDPLWLVDESGDGRTFSPLGAILYGKIGVVHFEGCDFYIDCAVASSVSPAIAERWPLATPPPVVAGYDRARPGALVTKTGAATGTTRGIIWDTNYGTVAPAAGARDGVAAPKQLLVRPVNGHQVFSAEGDSGSLVLDESNRAVGLLWGTNTRGEGVACAIEPVLRVLNIALSLAGHHPSAKDSATLLQR